MAFGVKMTLAEEMIKLYESGDYIQAEILCDRLLENKEEFYSAYLFKGIIAADDNRHDEAIAFYQKAIDLYGIGFNTSIVKYYKSLSLFSIGKHKEGWQALFQARLENENFAPLATSLRRFATKGKQILTRQPPPAIIHVHAEAGYGDNFLFLRYLPLLVEKGYTVRYEARTSVEKLARDSLSQVEVVSQADDYPGISGLKDFDYHLPVVDLPFIFQTEIDTIPWNGPYLRADPELVEKYSAAKGKIGICWSANPTFRIQQRGSYAYYKTVDFDLLRPIIETDPSRFVSLQAGPARGEAKEILDCLPKDDDMTFADTAAVIENCDLVISIDTAVAHLAGAMGKPCWVMMHKHLTSFQFLAERPGSPWNTRNPWYPSLRVFRQKVRGDWGPVIKDISDGLKEQNDAAA